MADSVLLRGLLDAFTCETVCFYGVFSTFKTVPWGFKLAVWGFKLAVWGFNLAVWGFNLAVWGFKLDASI